MGWTLIESQTLTGTAASVTLGSGGTIPQTYKTLKLVVAARGDGASGGGGTLHNNEIMVRINNDSGSNYTTRSLSGLYNNAYLATTGSGTVTGVRDIYINNPGGTASTFSNTEYVFPNYSSSASKVVQIDSVEENNITTSNNYSWFLQMYAFLWSSSSAVTSLVCFVNSGSANFVSGSTFNLYGLR